MTTPYNGLRLLLTDHLGGLKVRSAMSHLRPFNFSSVSRQGQKSPEKLSWNLLKALSGAFVTFFLRHRNVHIWAF